MVIAVFGALYLSLAAAPQTSRLPDSSFIKKARSLDEKKTGVLARETRELLYSLHEPSHSMVCAVPDPCILETAIGMEPFIKEIFDGDVSFALSLTGEDGRDTLLFERHIALSDWNKRKAAWEEVKIDLSPYSGKEIKIVFAKSAGHGERLREVEDLLPIDFMYWAKPHIRPKRLEGKPNVILVSLDTVRADHLGLLGYHRETSLNLDKLARQGCFFTTAVSQAPWTCPSHFSIFTAVYPRVHEAIQPSHVFPRHWNPSLPTMASILREEGYLTGAFTGYGSISAQFGFLKGFDFYNESGPYRSDIENVFGKALPWLRRNADRTFFLFIHTYEPHHPYISDYFAKREGIQKSDETAWRTAHYDGDIRTADSYVGKLMAELDALGLTGNTLLIVTSDHGEDLEGTRNPPDAHLKTGHGYNLYDEMLLVPLILRGPGIAPREKGIEHQIRLIDILPTVLDYLEYPLVNGLQGRSFRPMIEGTDKRDKPALSEAVGFGFPRESIRHNGFKYVHRFSDEPVGPFWVGKPPVYELYDLAADPGERNNIATENEEAATQYQKLMGALFGQPPRTGAEPEDAARTWDEDPELIEALKNLGYLK